MARRLNGWFGQSRRHSQAARRGRGNRPSSMYDLRGLSDIVRTAVAQGQLTEVDFRLDEHYVVADGIVLGDRDLKVKDELRVPRYAIMINQDKGWVVTGKGGTFYNKEGHPDNYCFEPTRYIGPARVLKQPVTLEAYLPSGETVPFAINGVIGLEALVRRDGANRQGNRVLAGTAYRSA